MSVRALDCSPRQLNFKDGFPMYKPYRPSYGANGQYYTFQTNSPLMPIILGSVECPDNATDLSYCTARAMPQCTHLEDVGKTGPIAVRGVRIADPAR